MSKGVRNVSANNCVKKFKTWTKNTNYVAGGRFHQI